MKNAHAPIEHGAGRIGPVSAHIFDTVSAAYQRALALAEDGIEVIGLHAGARNPMITVKPRRWQAKQLRGSVYKRGCDSRGPYRVMVSSIYAGVEIRWTERGN